MEFIWKESGLPNTQAVEIVHRQIRGSGSVTRDDERGGAQWFAGFDHRGAYESEASGEVVFTFHSQEENVEAAKRQVESFLRAAIAEMDRPPIAHQRQVCHEG